MAWKEFFRDKKNKKDATTFSLRLAENIFSLHNDLISKKYKHGCYEAFKINDPKPRDIHKATVRDRLLHHAVYRILYTYFDSKFIHDSYSCRLDKGTHKAIDRLRDFFRKVSKNHTKTCWVLKCDIRKFFANIDYDILKSILAEHIEDQDILWLLGQAIDSFHSPVRALGSNFKRGLPLGNLTSQLLVNIFMNEFDQFVKRELKVKYYIRYADDFVFLSEDKEYLNKILGQVKAFLENKLRLNLHSNKVFIKTIASGVDFLGWVHFPKHRVLRTVTKRRMFRKLKENKKEEVKQSYLGMLSHGAGYKLTQKFQAFDILKQESILYFEGPAETKGF